MNYDRMRELAGVPAVELKAVVIETVEEATAEEIVTAEVTDEEVAVEEVVAEAKEDKADDKAPELDTKEENSGKATKVPADVMSAISKRIAELKQSIAQYNDKGYDDGGVKPNAIEALEQIAANLKLEDGLAKANVFYGTLMSPITDLFPPKVVKFLHGSKGKIVSEGRHDIAYYIYSIFPGDGSRIYLSTENGQRAEWSPDEVKNQLKLLNRGGKTIWHAESNIEVPTRGEDRPGSGYERYSDDTAERDGPEYDDQFGY